VREETPRSLWESAEFRGACPASAVVMALRLGTPALLVRRAAREDAPAIARIYNDGIEDRATLETEPRSAQDRETWLAQRGPRHPVLVGVRRDALVGWVALAPFSMRPAYRFVADLSVYVARAARGQGVGTRLLEDILDRARALHYHKVVLTTLTTLDAALALYAKLGFRHVGDYREQGQLDGRWVDTRLMERILEKPD
jgi:phosphinothricin acetyltransferase